MDFPLVVSGLGIFGLASFVAEQRTRELGIRKVLGAAPVDLWTMLSKDFVVLVMISSVLAIPLAFAVMRSWLQNYSYHTGIPWWVVAGSAVSVLLITLSTVSYQTTKAALTNPVDSLRSE